MRESMPLLLTESLDAIRREQAHQHIEGCASCGEEWLASKEAWSTLADLPEVDVPVHVKTEFLARIGAGENAPAPNVVPFPRRPSFKWIAQAAAVLVLAGGGFFAGRGTSTSEPARTPAQLTDIRPAAQDIRPVSLVETRVLPSESLSPVIEGRPNINNVQFVDVNAADGQIGVSFDVTSRWTVTGNPKDRSIVRLLSYVLENEASVTPRSNAMEWVRRTYSDPAYADPEIANALAKVLSNDEHEGVRIRAVETLTTLPASVSSDTRDALIHALKSDPNPAVRIKAVEALANLARSGAVLDPTMVDTLRQKASQDDENLYVRVKAAEALGSIK